MGFYAQFVQRSVRWTSRQHFDKLFAHFASRDVVFTRDDLAIDHHIVSGSTRLTDGARRGENRTVILRMPATRGLLWTSIVDPRRSFADWRANAFTIQRTLSIDPGPRQHGHAIAQ